MAVVQFDVFHTFIYLGVVLQYHYVPAHVVSVEVMGQPFGLGRREVVRFRYHDQHVLLIEVEVRDVLRQRGVVSNSVQFQELHPAIYDGLPRERARR